MPPEPWPIYQVIVLIILTAIHATSLLFALGTLAFGHVLPWYTFNINATRYSTLDCQGQAIIGESFDAKPDECISWSESFAGLSYLWEAHHPWDEEPKDYGECKITVWTVENCEGEPHDHINKANNWTNFSQCRSIGAGKSLKLTCNYGTDRNED